MKLDQSRPTRVAYLVHDLHDAAVQRRFTLLTGEGMDVRLGGFRRHGTAPGSQHSGQLDLGRTMDARLVRRAMSVLRHLIWPRSVRVLCRDVPVIMARNLEMLALACRVRTKGQRLVYECLDLHRLMLGSGFTSRLMRWMERRLLARTNLILVSSPAFAREYFGSRQGCSNDVLLVENKVPSLPRAEGRRPREEGGTVIIGWFGMLRCRRSLQQLQTIVQQARGKVEVLVAGIPSPAEFPDFEAQVTARPGVTYLGPYTQDDLPALYARVDYVWAIDYFEEGLNSRWLLPNRLYEGIAHGVAPIALRGVETGRWLEEHGVGLLVDDPVGELADKMLTLSDEAQRAMRLQLGRLPQEAVIQTAPERRAIALAVAGCRDA